MYAGILNFHNLRETLPYLFHLCLPAWNQLPSFQRVAEATSRMGTVDFSGSADGNFVNKKKRSQICSYLFVVWFSYKNASNYSIIGANFLKVSSHASYNNTAPSPTEANALQAEEPIGFDTIRWLPLVAHIIRQRHPHLGSFARVIRFSLCQNCTLSHKVTQKSIRCVVYMNILLI